MCAPMHARSLGRSLAIPPPPQLLGPSARGRPPSVRAEAVREGPTNFMNMYTALGGSNTCGHGLRKSHDAFQHLVFSGLKEMGRAHQLQPSCVPAMGPDYPASCLSYFAPNATAFATLEFTPNMGDSSGELSRNGAHLTQMARQLLRRGVRVVLVSLVPRPPTCSSCIANFRAAHERIELVASDTRLPLVTMHYAASTWSDDLKHLNEIGHKEVASRVVAHLADDAAWSARRPPPLLAASSSPDVDTSAPLPICVFGADLERMMLPSSRGFGVTWRVGKHKDKPGLVTTTPDSVLRLCVRGLPASFGMSLALERSDVLPMSNVSLGCEGGCVCPLELCSNGDWTLRYQGKGRRRATESYMHRVFGARHGVAHDGLGEPDHGCDCVLTLRNTPTPGDPRPRAKINGLVAGASGAIGWANRFHMNLNPTVLAG